MNEKQTVNLVSRQFYVWRDNNAYEILTFKYIANVVDLYY